MERSSATPTSTTADAPAEKEYAGVKISLENCLFPQDALEETPSQKDGLEKTAEDDLRRIGCEYIQIAGIMLKVPQVAMAAAQILFQRFFFAKSFVKHKMEEIAMACIWLASKVEECPRRVRDVINVFHYLKLQRSKLPVSPMVLDQEYVTLKNNVIKAERRVLKELGFCVHIKHPHKIIVVYLQVLELEKNRELVQTAWNYMNDSLQTTVFVQYPPETIACACIYLAARVLQIPLPNRPNWFYLFNSTEEDIQKICFTLLCVYQTVKTPYHELEKKVDTCREVLQQKKLKARISQIEEAASQSAANSPLSKPASPAPASPSSKEKHGSAQRSSTVPANSESSRVSNGTHEKNGGIRRSHGSGYKRSRSRSRSGHQGSKYRRNSSTSSSSSAGSSPSAKGKNYHSDLPKSYSQQNSNAKSSEKRHQNRKDKKHHSSKHHRRREDGSGHRSNKDYHSYRRDSSKKHKRKFSPDSPVKHSRVNGDERTAGSPSRKHRHRESHKKRKR